MPQGSPAKSLPTSRRWRTFLAILTILLTALLVFWNQRSTPRAIGPLTQDVYIWQRAWTDPVQSALRQHAGSFANLTLLAAQVSWDRAASTASPRITRVAIDWPTIKAAKRPVALAIRVNEYHGAYLTPSHAAAGQAIADLASSLIAEACQQGGNVTEIQIDFDAAESKLEAYRAWIAAISARTAPIPVGITVLPSWLDSRDFGSLASATGAAGYVLQVHSFEKPTRSENMTLCDPAAARAAVERAGKIGIPFRVALPTYGYFVAFDENGNYIALSAEGRQANWPASAIVREVRAQPSELADLIASWSKDRPAAMTGVIWYRLPTEADNLNWRWPTLAAVMQGRAPAGQLQTIVSADEPHIRSVEILNTGEGEAALSSAIVASSKSGIESADGLGQFSVTLTGDQARFTPISRTQHLAPGERLPIGWLRLKTPSYQIQTHVAQ